MTKKLNCLDVVGYEGLYKVTENGDVISVERTITSAYGGKRKVGGVKKQNKNFEYSTVKLNKDGEKKRFFVHTLVCMSFHKDEYFEGAVVNHKDGNKFNNNYNNLEWVTIGGNQLHAYKNNLRKKITGVNNNKSKLTEEDVISIYSLRNDHKNSYQVIAEKFGVTKRAIICVCKGITWKEVYDRSGL